MEGNTPRGVCSIGHYLVSVNVTTVQSAVSSIQGESRRHQGQAQMLGTAWSLSACLSADISNLHALPHRPQPGCLLPHCPNSIFTQQSSEASRDLLFPCVSPSKLPIWPWHGTGLSNPVALTAQLWLVSRPLVWPKWPFCVSPLERLGNSNDFPFTSLYFYSFNYLAESLLGMSWPFLFWKKWPAYEERRACHPSINPFLFSIHITHTVCTYTFI